MVETRAIRVGAHWNRLHKDGDAVTPLAPRRCMMLQPPLLMIRRRASPEEQLNAFWPALAQLH